MFSSVVLMVREQIGATASFEGAESHPCTTSSKIRCNKEKRVPDPVVSHRPVAVLGAGLTGASWTALFAAHAREVRVFDKTPERARSACARALEMGRFLVDKGLADPKAFALGSESVHAVGTMEEALAGAEHAQECVAEDLDLKRAVFAQADRAAAPDTILATSSSGLSISDIQTGLSGAGRCIAAHPYNPPHLIPIVELAPGSQTDQAARSAPAGPVIVDGATAEVINVVPGATRATLASGERTTLVKFEMEAGATIPKHSHPHEQTGFLVSGDLMLFGEDGEWPVTVGDSWSIPGAMAHGAHTEAGATIVEVFTPVRTEYLPGPPGRPPSR